MVRVYRLQARIPTAMDFRPSRRLWGAILKAYARSSLYSSCFRLGLKIENPDFMLSGVEGLEEFRVGVPVHTVEFLNPE